MRDVRAWIRTLLYKLGTVLFPALTALDENKQQREDA